MKNRGYFAFALVAPIAAATWLGACSSDGGSSSSGSSPSNNPDSGAVETGGPAPTVTGNGEQAKVTVTGPSAPVQLVQGGSVEIEVAITRSGPAGSVQLTITDLPAKVIATAETIPAGTVTAKLKLVAEASADQVVAKPKVVATVVGATARAEATFGLTVRGPAGALDTTFGTNGRVLFAASNLMRGVHATKDGKVLAWGGDGTDPVLARYLPDGTLDPSFADAGRYKRKNTGAAGPTSFEAAATLADGRIMLLTTRGSGSPRAVLTRVGADGVYDATFGEQVLGTGNGVGVAIRREAGGRLAVQYTNNAPMITRLLDADGTPTANVQSTCGDDLSGGVTALLSTTEALCYPTTFNGVEKRTLGADTVAAQSADLGLDFGSDTFFPGRVVLQGPTRAYAAGMVGGTAALFGLANADLALDAAYGTAGKADSFAGSKVAFALATGGDTVTLGGESAGGVVVARHLANGKLDPGFGSAGVATLPTDGQSNLRIHGLTALPDGRVVVAIVGTDSRLLRLWP